MGEPEQVIAEPDEEQEEAVVQGLHPHTLQEPTPWFLSTLVTTVVNLLGTYGWHLLAVVVVCVVAINRLGPWFRQWFRRRQDYREAAQYHKDPDLILSKQRALDLARERMQSKYNAAAQAHQEKLKQREEQARQERIQDWEKHQRGEGYRNKSRHVTASATTSAAASSSSISTAASSSSTSTSKAKPRLRPEYNPMTGDVGNGSCRWRPSERGGAGGG